MVTPVDTALCIGSQTHWETEEPYRCQPFNLFCKQFIIEIKLGLLLVGAEGRGKKAQIRGNVTKDFKLIFFDLWLKFHTFLILLYKGCPRTKPAGLSQQLATAEACSQATPPPSSSSSPCQWGLLWSPGWFLLLWTPSSRTIWSQFFSTSVAMPRSLSCLV